MGIKERVIGIGCGLAATGVVIGTAYACSPSKDASEITPNTQTRISETSEKTADGSFEDNENLVNEADFRIAQENLLKTISWMDSQENPQIRAAADFIQKEVKRENFVISGSNTKAAYVAPASRSEKPHIIFSIRALSDQEFSEKQAAVFLFEAFYVYKGSREDPKRFSLDSSFRSSLEFESQKVSSQVFSLPETK